MIFTSTAHKRRFAITLACLLAFAVACVIFGPWFLISALIAIFGAVFLAIVVMGVWDCTSDNPGGGRGYGIRRRPPL